MPQSNRSKTAAHSVTPDLQETSDATLSPGDLVTFWQNNELVRPYVLTGAVQDRVPLPDLTEPTVVTFTDDPRAWYFVAWFAQPTDPYPTPRTLSGIIQVSTGMTIQIDPAYDGVVTSSPYFADCGVITTSLIRARDPRSYVWCAWTPNRVTLAHRQVIARLVLYQKG